MCVRIVAVIVVIVVFVLSVVVAQCICTSARAFFTRPSSHARIQILRLIRGAPERTFDSALLAGGWNLLTQTGLPCLLECEARGIAVHIAGVFASGLLAVAPGNSSATYAYRPAQQLMVLVGVWVP